MSEICLIEVMEITPEEKEKIVRDRVEKERKEEIRECFVTLNNCLSRIRELGGSVYLPAIGGKYISRHFPRVCEGLLKLSFTKNYY